MVESTAREVRGGDEAHLDALAYRMGGSLLMLAGVLLLGTCAGVLQFHPVIRAGVRAYVVPGTGGRHALDATATSIVAWSGGVLSALGLVGLMLGRAKIRRPVGVLRIPSLGRSPRPLWRSVLILVAGLVVLAGVVYARRL